MDKMMLKKLDTTLPFGLLFGLLFEGPSQFLGPTKRHYDTQHNDIQHNDSHEGFIYDAQHK